jgi:hypothetical protein
MTTDTIQKVASLIGTPGLVSDCGRAITYYWRLYTNDQRGEGFYDHHKYFKTEAEARSWCTANGYTITKTAWN